MVQGNGRAADMRPDPTPFEDLVPPDMVAFALAEVEARSAKLDRMCARRHGLNVTVSHPDGLVWLTLGDDGRLVALFIDDAVPRIMTHLDLEDALNELVRAGNEALADLVDAEGASGIDAREMVVEP